MLRVRLASKLCYSSWQLLRFVDLTFLNNSFLIRDPLAWTKHWTNDFLMIDLTHPNFDSIAKKIRSANYFAEHSKWRLCLWLKHSENMFLLPIQLHDLDSYGLSRVLMSVNVKQLRSIIRTPLCLGDSPNRTGAPRREWWAKSMQHTSARPNGATGVPAGPHRYLTFAHAHATISRIAGDRVPKRQDRGFRVRVAIACAFSRARAK